VLPKCYQSVSKLPGQSYILKEICCTYIGIFEAKVAPAKDPRQQNSADTRGVGIFWCAPAEFAGAGLLLAHLKIKMRQQTLTLILLYDDI
jgi:hypothetical protein